MRAPGSKTGIEFSCPLTRVQAEAIYAQGREVMIFVLMELAAPLANYEQEGLATTPSTPSGMVAPHEKPKVRKRRKKPGAKAGHAGTHREPAQVTGHQEHPPLRRCPDCGRRLKGPAERRFRLIEEIIDTQPEVTEHSIPRHWCARCEKFVEPPVPDAMPASTFGHRVAGADGLAALRPGHHAVADYRGSGPSSALQAQPGRPGRGMATARQRAVCLV